MSSQLLSLMISGNWFHLLISSSQLMIDLSICGHNEFYL